MHNFLSNITFDSISFKRKVIYKMGVKSKFDKLLKQVGDVDQLVQQVTVAGKKDEFIKKLKSIKQKCNKIVIPKFPSPKFPSPKFLLDKPHIKLHFNLWFQSLVNQDWQIKSIRSTYDDAFYYVSQIPEDWDITWVKGALQTLIVEYKQNEERNPDYTLDPIYVEVYDLTQCLQPLFGTGNMDVDENYQSFGSYLGSVDSSAHLSVDKKDFQGELIVPGVGRSVHVSGTTTPSVTGESVLQEGNGFASRRFKSSTDYGWYECTAVRVQGTVITVSISGCCKDGYFRPTEMWTPWKKLELRSGGTIKCMMATIQADGGFVVADEKDPSIEKVKQLIQRLYIDKE